MSTVLIAAGGTGGHMFPAAALATALLARGHRIVLATDARGRVNSDFDPRVAIVTVPAAHLAGRPAQAVGALIANLRGTVAAWRLIGRERPDIAVGFGGYASLPTMLAAWARRLPLVLHEQNALLGRANRLLASRAQGIALSFAEVAKLRPEDRARARLTGNPVRAAIAAIGDQPYAPAKDGGLTLLVVGGSLGARIFSEVVPAALARLPETLRKRLKVAQQARAEDQDRARAGYAAAGIEVELAPFFSDIPARLAAADLVIARAGASTVAELMAAGRPALLVPYPHAADDHQTANAQALDRVGGAWLMPQPYFTAETLALRLQELAAAPAALAQAAASARAAGRTDAAMLLANLVEDTLFGRPAAPARDTEAAARSPEGSAGRLAARIEPRLDLVGPDLASRVQGWAGGRNAP